MWPILLAPPTVPFTLRAYPAALVLTVIVGTATSLVLARRVVRLSAGRLLLALATITLAGLAGARTHFLLVHPEFRALSLHVFAVWDGGLHAAGGIAAIVVAVPLLAWRLRFPAWSFADALAPAASVSLAIYRVGCFLHGCCFGRHCAYPWCIAYPRTSYAFLLDANARLVPPDALASLPVHPLPLYYIGVALVILAFGLWRLPRRSFPGEVALVSLLLFSLSTMALEFLRADTPETVYWGTWPALVIAAGVLALTAALLLAGMVAMRSWRSTLRQPEAPWTSFS